jgi:tRNA pseudouridine55 synthase
VPRDPGPDGLCVVDKAPGWTSHDVVAKARGLLGTRRVGHAGTLDPGATGVLLLGVGRVTRLMRFLSGLPKSYVGEVVLGAETSTLDDEGDVTATHDMAGVRLEDVRAAAARFVGDIEQVPPMVSAVRVGGRRLHELAREGIEVDRAPRRVTVHSLAIEGTAEPHVFRMAVECSSGTYVRTLAADLGHALGGGAHLRRLRRTAVGPYALAEATPLDDLRVQPPVEAVRGLDRVAVGDDVAVAVSHGRVLDRGDLGIAGDGPWAVVHEASGELLAVYEPRGERAKPAVVLAPASSPRDGSG